MSPLPITPLCPERYFSRNTTCSPSNRPSVGQLPPGLQVAKYRRINKAISFIGRERDLLAHNGTGIFSELVDNGSLAFAYLKPPIPSPELHCGRIASHLDTKVHLYL